MKQVLLWCCEFERVALKSRGKAAAEVQQMEDEFSHLHQGPGSSPGKAGVSHFRSIQVNNNPTLEGKEGSTELQLMPAEYQELIF